ncbi:hypothetical protein ABW20_dc0106825 [Dactylellina cionopaga]|nr:hypothetical protein ABW20_dc0106825 [Dactylellina cionopaga]
MHFSLPTTHSSSSSSGSSTSSPSEKWIARPTPHSSSTSAYFTHLLKRRRRTLYFILFFLVCSVVYLYHRNDESVNTYKFRRPSASGGKKAKAAPSVVLVVALDKTTMSTAFSKRIIENRRRYAEKWGYEVFTGDMSEYEAGNEYDFKDGAGKTRHYAKDGHSVKADTFIIRRKDEEIGKPKKGGKKGLVMFGYYLLDVWFDPLYRFYHFRDGETSALEHMVQWHPTILAKMAIIPQRVMLSYPVAAGGNSPANKKKEEKDADDKKGNSDDGSEIRAKYAGVGYESGDFVVHFEKCGQVEKDKACMKEFERYWKMTEKYKRAEEKGRGGAGKGKAGKAKGTKAKAKVSP